MFKNTSKLEKITRIEERWLNTCIDVKDEGKADFSELAVQLVTSDNTRAQYSNVNVPPDLAIISLESKTITFKPCRQIGPKGRFLPHSAPCWILS